MATFNDRIKALRTASGCSQPTVAQAIGITDRAYRSYETGVSSPRMEQLIAIAEFFGVSLDYLVGRSDDPARH